jgi:hypothetical protein
LREDNPSYVERDAVIHQIIGPAYAGCFERIDGRLVVKLVGGQVWFEEME